VSSRPAAPGGKRSERYAPATGVQKGSAQAQGEALMGDLKYGIDPGRLRAVALEISQAAAAGTEVAIVVAPGTSFEVCPVLAGHRPCYCRLYGHAGHGDELHGLQDALRKLSTHSRVLSAIAMQEVCEPYIREERCGILKRGGW